MAKELWLNLPVKDVARSRKFFSELGFKFHPRHENSDEMAGLIIGDKQVMVMLFPEAVFKSFISNEIADTKLGTEVLISIDAQSKQEVDELIARAVAAGGEQIGKSSDQGWMYGGGFIDLDGHRWNVLYMDESKIPKD
ncbi:VOC family protein [Paenibacillus harenae]|uniref:Lactoylglutathione lyase n=1 Tax=Paenibacillus harenae TaxID=306543 RepID=A0ABT9U379_PAEHA|nr:VOC family protein [Paenibacillus harenae]MDQ0114090.1 putative lactoylglutathione lyase [Paenibacillus harenae]